MYGPREGVAPKRGRFSLIRREKRVRRAPKTGAGSLSDDAEHGRDELPKRGRFSLGRHGTRERKGTQAGTGSFSDDAEYGREEHPRGAGFLSSDARRGKEETLITIEHTNKRKKPTKKKDTKFKIIKHEIIKHKEIIGKIKRKENTTVTF